MEISLVYQIVAFGTSIGIGVALSLIFDFFKIIELTLGKKELKTFFVDVIYFIFCAFISFLYMMVVSSGEIRIFYMIGEVAGWFLYHLTVGKCIFSVWIKLIFFLKKKFLKFKNFCNRRIQKLNLKNLLQIKFIKKKSIEK